MRVTLLSTFLLVIFFSYNNISYAQAGEYEIKKVCMGQGKYAAVVEHNSQYYVIVSNQVIRKNYHITDVYGAIQIGGESNIRFFHNNNRTDIPVTILDRKQWKYSGFPGARSVCRNVTTYGYGL